MLSERSQTKMSTDCTIPFKLWNRQSWSYCSRSGWWLPFWGGVTTGTECGAPRTKNKINSKGQHCRNKELQDSYHSVTLRPLQCPRALLSSMPLSSPAQHTESIHALPSQQMTRRFPGFKNRPEGLPWWRSGWESACQCRGHGFEPWSGKIPHAAEQLGPWATTTEPAHLESVLRNKRGRDSERPAHRDEEWPPLATTRESPCTETKTQHSHK